MSKIKTFNILKKNTQDLVEIEAAGNLTAESISDEVGIQRNTTSQYLNEFVKENSAIKIKSRPAYFFDKTVFEELFFKPKRSIYDNLQQLLDEQYFSKRDNSDVFESIIGAYSSLKTAIDQIKASVMYPGLGLPIMLHGETGVGKSLLARKIYEFCLGQKLVSEDAPFLELNCAQYYHNQELLSSILFGYKKGAFTGANEDQIGLLEAADGGVLFLDECHRLSPESQEKLFTFIDKQTFQRIGDNNHNRASKVRLVFATTEDIQKNFLRTFIRRVPITINIPALQQRTKQEISEYIFTFFLRESNKLNKEIVITPWIMNRLMTIKYQDNVGELGNLVKIICAGAYSQQVQNKQILINAESIEETTLSRFLALKEIDNLESHEVVIKPNTELVDYIQTENNNNTLVKEMYKIFAVLFHRYQEQEITSEYLIQQLSREVSTMIETFIYDEKEEVNTSLQMLKSTIKELVTFLESNYFIKIRGNSIIALASYLYRRNKVYRGVDFFDSSLSDQINTFIGKHLPMEQKILNALLELVETKLDVTLTDAERILMTFYFKGLDLEIKRPEIHGIILAHGFSTASSIADVVNHFMEEHLFDSFDMPFNVSLDSVETFMRHYLANEDCTKGLVILADMGSLMILSDRLKDVLEGPLLMMNNVTTQQALFVGEMIKKNKDMAEIGEKVVSEMQPTYKLTYPKIKKKPLIITVCHTGLGAAQQLKSFLDASLPEKIGYHVEAVDYHYLKKYGKNNSLFKQYDVQGIVGTENPGIEDVTYISLEDLVSGNGKEYIDKIFDIIDDNEIRKEINDNLVRNLSIERLISAITILDVERVISYIEDSMSEVERRLRIILENSKKAILYVHIAGLVERSIRNHEIEKYTDHPISKERERKVAIIAQALENIELAYSIKISEFELNYLYDIIYDI